MKLLTVYFLVLVALLMNVTGCAKNEAGSEQPKKADCTVKLGSLKDVIVGDSLPGIQKDTRAIQCMPESTPVVWNNEVLIVGPDRILNFETHEIVATFEQGGIFTSALVVDDTLFMFATDSPNIRMTSSKDLATWMPWETIFTIDRSFTNQVYNTSVIKTVDGFVMAYEVDGEPGQLAYSWHVAVGPTLHTMVRVSQLFSLEYSACPSVKYVDGWYQFIYLQGIEKPGSNGTAGAMVTKIARTKDFITYEKSDKIFLAPTVGEGVNNSDADMIEFNGKVYITYMDGNQGGWDDQRTAIYDGTFEDMFNQIWE